MLMTPPVPDRRYVGKSVLRREGVGKVTGAAKYVDDLVVPGAIYGKTVRSPIAAGRILGIDFPEGHPWSEITVVTAADVPWNRVALILDDQPVLCDGVIQHKEEPVLLLAHPSREVVEAAARAVRIRCEATTPILRIGQGEIQKKYHIVEGDIEAEFAASEVVFERWYETGAQEHVYIEPNGFIAEWKGETVELRGSLQCPYYVHKAVTKALKLRDDQVDVIQTTTGGGFGGKEDFPSVLGIHAALLAKKSGRPVRLIYDRHEDMAASTKRHPSRARVRTGCMKDGTLRALDFEFHVDGGAYLTLSSVVLSRGIVHSFGPYKWPAAVLQGKSWMTNSPPYGAFRGFGAPQSLFAMEAHMNLLAEHLGMDPIELRRKNFLHRGDMLPTGQLLEEDPHLEELVDRAMELSDYAKKRAAFGKGSMRGIGVSTFLHGTGFTGSGEVYLDSKVALELRADGIVEILVASTEIGQGTETVFSQIAAEELGIGIDQIIFHVPQTSCVPNSGPTVASRTTSVVGRLVQQAAAQLRARLGGLSPSDYAAQHGGFRVDTKYIPRPGIVWDDVAYKGSAYGAYSWSCNIAEVSIDPVTYAPKVEQFVATVDTGTIINPVLAIGQVEGGIAQGIGWATCENVVLKDGVMANGQMTNYIIPTSADAAEVIVEFYESPYAEGAFGAKGVGELPMDGPGPAISGAVLQALGREARTLPITPESLMP